MQYEFKRPTALVVLAVLMSSPSLANVITISAQDYAYGTNISSIGSGLTISALEYTESADGTYATTRSDVYADPSVAMEGNTVPGYQTEGKGAFYSASGRYFFGDLSDFYDCRDGGSGCGYHAALELLFERPIDFLLLGAFDSADPLGLVAFNSAGELLASCSLITGARDGCGWANLSDGSNQVWLTGNGLDIARVLVGAAFYQSSVNLISYRFADADGANVPAPSATALLVLGLAGLALRRRRNGN